MISGKVYNLAESDSKYFLNCIARHSVTGFNTPFFYSSEHRITLVTAHIEGWQEY